MKLAFICGSGYGRSDSLIITRKLRLLADDNESEVFVFIRGSEGNDKYREIAKNGAHKVFVCDTGLNSFIEMCRLWIIRNDIHMMAFQDTEEGRKMASVLAMMLDGGLTADCINIEYDKKDGFQFFRAALSDSIVAKIKCINTDYQLCTIKQNSFQIKKELSYETGNIEYLKPEKEVKEALAQVISSKKIEKKSVSLVNAERLFCFGRGIGSKEESDKLRTLAKLCNAEISGTRAVVDPSWYFKGEITKNELDMARNSLNDHDGILSGIPINYQSSVICRSDFSEDEIKLIKNQLEKTLNKFYQVNSDKNTVKGELNGYRAINEISVFLEDNMSLKGQKRVKFLEYMYEKLYFIYSRKELFYWFLERVEDEYPIISVRNTQDALEKTMKSWKIILSLIIKCTIKNTDGDYEKILIIMEQIMAEEKRFYYSLYDLNRRVNLIT